ncbi:MAG: 2-oxoacid:ferredoxin oxidoreductase subunit gamma [Ruminococcaceae bacterium]|jgi:2-oxoglutarate ferredoxin oxidoreductase subunit gamma|nr:2-oxoacid:ferredoxin oxidoreductase subunit gamma [Oscillospiraceae bacterium]
MSRQELRLTGSGGQGVVLATVILAEAGYLAKKAVAQSQSYGPEARGGMCKAEVVISDDVIHYTKVEHATFLLALTQEALNKYLPDITPDAVVMIDSSLDLPETGLEGHQVYQVPILQTAIEKVGRAQTGNIVAVAAINAVLHLAPDDILEEAVKMHIPKGTEELNMKALAEGKKLIH